MASQSRKLRGWKDIAAHLRATERTARRWERTRRLPIHRVRGQSQDAVFADVEELDAWLEADGDGPRRGLHACLEPPAQGPGRDDAARDLVTPGLDLPSPARRSLRGTLRGERLSRGTVVAIACALLALSLFVYATRGSWTAAGGPKRWSLFRITFGAWTATIQIPQGECGTVDLKEGGTLKLCPQPDGEAILMTVSASRPGPAPPPREPLTVRLHRKAEVRLLGPATFALEWLGNKGSR